MKKLKAGLLLSLILFCSSLALVGAVDEKPDKEISRLRHLGLAEALRFQVISFEFKNGDVQTKTMMKVDGVSGKTWIIDMTDLVANGSFNLKWRELK